MTKSSHPSPALREILAELASGNLSVDEAAQQLSRHETVAIDGATIDIGRAVRCRFGEVIYGEGKSSRLIADIAREQLKHGQSVFITRLSNDAATEIGNQFSFVQYHELARTMRISSQPIPTEVALQSEVTGESRPLVLVVSAGSTDAAVANEATQTLQWMNVANDQIHDVGVAGPQRLLAVVPRLRQATVIVVVAGMEAALASAVGGHVACPIIAVPTSVGYGTNFGGVTALLGMLTSCTSNVTVVGIDAGFKGGYVAGLIATQLEDHIIKSRR